MLTRPVRLLQEAHVKAAAALTDKGLDTITATAARRILREMKDILNTPHSEMDVYPCADDIRFWRVVLEAPHGTP